MPTRRSFRCPLFVNGWHRRVQPHDQISGDLMSGRLRGPNDPVMIFGRDGPDLSPFVHLMDRHGEQRLSFAHRFSHRSALRPQPDQALDRRNVDHDAIINRHFIDMSTVDETSIYVSSISGHRFRVRRLDAS